MPPKAVHQREHRGRTKRGGRDGMWEAIRKLRRFTALDIEGETRCNLESIKTYIKSLKKAGYIAIVDHLDNAQSGLAHPLKYKAAVYELQRDSITTPRVRRNGDVVTMGAGREQLWRTMRVLKVFSYLDLAVQASTEEHPVSEADARHYLKYLKRAGYIAEIERGKGGRPSRYRFIDRRYTGPRPPMIQRVRQVYDPNLQKVVWPTGEDVHE